MKICSRRSGMVVSGGLSVGQCCTLLYMRRMNLKMLWPIGHRVQSLNPQCSQSHFRPLRRTNALPSTLTKKRAATLASCVVTRIELFHQRRHCVGDGVSSDEQVVSQVSSRTFWESYSRSQPPGTLWTQYQERPATAAIPWAKASWTSPPTPMSESWGVWVGVVTAESEWMGVGMGRLMLWLGEERGEPGPWVCNVKSSVKSPS